MRFSLSLRKYGTGRVHLPAVFLSLCLATGCSQWAGASDKPGANAMRPAPPAEPAEPSPPASTPANDTTGIGDTTPIQTVRQASPGGTDGSGVAATRTLENDLTADKPEAGAAKPVAVSMLEDLEPSGPMNTKATRCFTLIAEMKSNAEQIRSGLSDGGKQITNLISESDSISKAVTDLSKLWPSNERFLDVCTGAKRSAVVMNDELSSTPRQWTHVRWAYTNLLQDLRKVRLWARMIAEAEPKPVAVVGKDGKVTYVDAPTAPIDPKILRRNEAVRKTEEAARLAAEAHDKSKDKEMEIDLRNVK